MTDQDWYDTTFEEMIAELGNVNFSDFQGKEKNSVIVFGNIKYDYRIKDGKVSRTIKSFDGMRELVTKAREQEKIVYEQTRKHTAWCRATQEGKDKGLMNAYQAALVKLDQNQKTLDDQYTKVLDQLDSVKQSLLA